MVPKQVPLTEMSLNNDFMFGAVFSDLSICKAFLEKLLDIIIAKIEIVQGESSLDCSHDFRGVRLDVSVLDISGHSYRIEIVPTDNALARSRLYLSAFYSDVYADSEACEDDAPLYIIFLCNDDPVGLGYAQYIVETSYRDVPAVYDDGTHVIFLNSHYIDDATHANANPEILEFLRYLGTGNDDEPVTTEFAGSVMQKVLEIREDKTWQTCYGLWVQKCASVHTAGRNEGRESTLIGLARKNLLTTKQAADELGITEAEVKHLMASTK